MYQEIRGHVVDVTNGKVYPNCELRMKEGVIRSLTKRHWAPNHFLMPGLIEVHSHLVLDPSVATLKMDETASARLKRARKSLKNSLRSGITTVRDCGYPTEEIFDIREEMERAPEKGSRVICCGPLITTKGGHAKDLGVEVSGVEQMEEVCNLLVSKQVDFIKLVNNDPGGFSVEEMQVAGRVAHKNNLPLACHLYQGTVLDRVLDADVDVIEHFTDAADEQARRVFDKGVIVVPTMVAAVDAIAHPEGSFIGEESIEESMDAGGFQGWLVRLRTGTQSLIDYGATIAAGTDAGAKGTEFNSVIREVEALVKVGMTPYRAIQAATINAARAINREGLLGSLEVGKVADIVVYKANPLEDLSVLRSPLAVYKEGILVSFE